MHAYVHILSQNTGSNITEIAKADIGQKAVHTRVDITILSVFHLTNI